MSRHVSLQTYVTSELGAQVRAAAEAEGQGTSEWLRTLVQRGCDNSSALATNRALLERLYRHSLFAFVGLDALLAGHPDRSLRERVHTAFAARCDQAGVLGASDEGASL